MAVINKLEIMLKNVGIAIIYSPHHHSPRYFEYIKKKNPGSRIFSPNENTTDNLTLYFTESYAKTFIQPLFISPTHALANHTISVLIYSLLKDKTLKIIGTPTCFGFP